MIDFHTHILPRIDDGAKGNSESKKIIEEACKAGFTKIISTSHYKENVYEVHEEDRKELLNKLNPIAENAGLELFLGSEIYITENMVNLLKSRKASSINNSRYVLFEIPFFNNVIYFDKVIEDLKENGYVPIVAHPERYNIIKKNPRIAEMWVEKGILLQSNYASIIGGYGKESKNTMEILLKHNLIYFLGSDVHYENSIYPIVKEACQKIKNIVGEEKFKQISEENAEKVLANEEIKVENTNGSNKIRKNILGIFK